MLAYHGCDSAVGEKVLAGKEEVLLSENDYDWLGSGAYFWENSPARAMQWAKFLHTHPTRSPLPIKEPFVLGAIITPGNCFDLSVATCLNLLRIAYSSYEDVIKSSNSSMPVNEKGHSRDFDLIKRRLDCAVINFYHDLREQEKQLPFDTVRCPFFEGEPVYKGSGIAARTHIQWRVRNPAKTIIGYFRPRPAELMEK